LQHAVVRGIRWTATARLAGQIVTWSSTFWVVRLLSPTDYGLVAIATIAAGYLAIWNEMGIGITLVQKRITDEATLRKIFTLLLITGVSLCGLAMALAPMLARTFHDPRITGLSCVAALNFLLMPFIVIPQSALSMNMRFKAISAVGIISSLVGAVTTVAFAYFKFGAYALVLGPLAMGVVRTVATGMLSRNILRPATSLRGIGTVFSFSGTVLLERTIWYAYSESDTFIVGRVLGPGNLGLYSMGRLLAQMPMERVSDIMNTVALPAYASIKEDIPRIRDAYQDTLRLGSLAMFPIFWGLAAVAGDLVPLLLGAKWTGSIPVLQLLCLVMPLRSLGTLTSPLLTAMGRMRDVVWCMVWPAVLVPVAVIVGVRWGLTGAALAWCVGYPLAFVLAMRRLCGAIGLRAVKMVHAIAPPFLAAAVMLVLVYGTGKLLPVGFNSGLRLATEVAVGAGVYLMILGVAFPALYRHGLSTVRLLVKGSNPGS
jgi:O-antigen/teichoic acid export membrane protein